MDEFVASIMKDLITPVSFGWAVGSTVEDLAVNNGGYAERSRDLRFTSALASAVFAYTLLHAGDWPSPSPRVKLTTVVKNDRERDLAFSR